MEYISIFSVLSALLCAVIIALDLRSRPQKMRIMNTVWILTVLWSNILGLIAYFCFGRSEQSEIEVHSSDAVDMGGSMGMNGRMEMSGMSMGGVKWRSVVLSTLHCGAGCTLADFIGEGALFFISFTIGGSALLGGWVLDYCLALIIGVYFQYFAIRSMSNGSVIKVLGQAIKADFLSLTAWQVGMYGWLLIVYFVIGDGPLSYNSWEFWFAMQQAMFFGFLSSLPINYLLIRVGIKHSM